MLKIIPIVLVVLVISVAFLAWKQHTGIQKQFASLESFGIDVSYKLPSRPAIVYDEQKSCVYLAQENKIEEIHISSIKEVIIFQSERDNNQEREDNTSRSHGQIIDTKGVMYRFDNYGTAESAEKYFKDIPELNKKVRLVNIH